MRRKLAFAIAVAITAFAGDGLEALKTKGKDAGITIFPVRLGDRLFPPVSEVIGILLENGGMGNVELTGSEFRLAGTGTVEEIATAFGEYVRRNPVRTGYALYGEFLGSPSTGISEIRAVLVDSQGNPVWTDRQKPAPGDPLGCAMSLARRLGGILRLKDVSWREEPSGKLGTTWAERTGMPSAAEREGMKRALETARKGFGAARVVVFPVLIGDRTDPARAAHLAGLLNQEKLGAATVAEAGPVFRARPGPNEQVRLWDVARAFREYLNKAPAAADYAVYADYGFAPDGSAFIVHFVVCRARGEWVIVDFQNDHHEDFRSIAPKTGDDCDRLVVRRLAGYVR